MSDCANFEHPNSLSVQEQAMASELHQQRSQIKQETGADMEDERRRDEKVLVMRL